MEQYYFMDHGNLMLNEKEIKRSKIPEHQLNKQTPPPMHIIQP